jgi:hypothetical protein
MRSTPEQRRSVWKRRSLFGLLLILLAIGFSRSGQAGRTEPMERVSPAAATAVTDSSVEASELATCPSDQVAITAADITIGTGVRCLPVGGDEVQDSRVDPLYGRIGAELVARISGQKEGVRSVQVICWSDEDWRELMVAFRNAGEIEPGRFWLGWVPRGRRVINLSSLACLQLDRITYHDSSLALPATGAAVGALAHEAMHVAGIHDEGVAECYGMQLTAVTAMRLGTEPDYADELRTVNFESNRDRRAGTVYDSPDCYDGGPLDLAPESSRWP